MTTTGGIPPFNPNNNPTPVSNTESSNLEGSGPWAKYFPTASPDQLKKIMNNFVNATIQQMKEDQNRVLEALKKMQNGDDS
jgi:hypothetical protein